MNIHEYQGKAVLKSIGAPVSEGVAIFSAGEAEAAAKHLGAAMGGQIANPCRWARQGQIRRAIRWRSGRGAFVLVN